MAALGLSFFLFGVVECPLGRGPTVKRDNQPRALAFQLASHATSRECVSCKHGEVLSSEGDTD